MSSFAAAHESWIGRLCQQTSILSLSQGRITINSLQSQKLRNLFRRGPYISPRRISPFFVSQGEPNAAKTKGRKNTDAVSGRCSLRIAAVQESSRLYWNSHFDAGAGHRRDHLHLYAGTCRAAEVAASGQAC